MRTDLGKALIANLGAGGLEQTAAAARRREAILRETSNANCQMDADRFANLAAAIDALGED